HASRQGAPVLRPRSALLPGRAAGPDGGAHRAAGAVHPVPRHDPGGTPGAAQAVPRVRLLRPPGTAGAAHRLTSGRLGTLCAIPMQVWHPDGVDGVWRHAVRRWSVAEPGRVDVPSGVVWSIAWLVPSATSGSVRAVHKKRRPRSAPVSPT